MIFCNNSGQKLNLTKSKVIFSKNCARDTRENCSNTLNIQSKDSFEKYLGFPIFHSKSVHNDFQPIIDNMQAKYNGWKT